MYIYHTKLSNIIVFSLSMLYEENTKTWCRSYHHVTSYTSSIENERKNKSPHERKESSTWRCSNFSRTKFIRTQSREKIRLTSSVFNKNDLIDSKSLTLSRNSTYYDDDTFSFVIACIVASSWAEKCQGSSFVISKTTNSIERQWLWKCRKNATWELEQTYSWFVSSSFFVSLIWNSCHIIFHAFLPFNDFFSTIENWKYSFKYAIAFNAIFDILDWCWHWTTQTKIIKSVSLARVNNWDHVDFFLLFFLCLLPSE